MMKVLMLIDRYAPIWGGAENQLRQLSQRLASMGCNITIVTRRWKKEYASVSRIDGIPVVRIGTPGFGLFPTVVYGFALFSFLLNKYPRIDIVHTHGAAALGAVGWLAARITHARNVSKIATAGRIPLLQKNLPGRMILSIFKSSDAIVCMSEEINEELISIGVSSSKILKIPNAVDINRFKRLSDDERKKWRRERGFGENDPVILFSGRFVYRKGLDILIRIWPSIVASFPTTRLILLGSGDNQPDSIENNIVDKIHREQIVNVHIEGETNSPESYLGVADIFAFPSRKEGFPNALLEAMAAGLAVVGFNIGGVTDLVQDGRTGLLASTENASEFRDKLIYLLGKPSEKKMIGDAARRHVEHNFPFETISRRYFHAYKKLTEKT